MNKANDNDWFIVKPDKTGLRYGALADRHLGRG